MRALLPALLLVPLLAVPAAQAAQAASAASAADHEPVVAGRTVYGQVLRAQPAGWSASRYDLAYRWRRDGHPLPGDAATGRSYALQVKDVGHRMSVRVFATAADGTTQSATSAESDIVQPAELRVRRETAVQGVQRFFHTVTAQAPRFSPRADDVRYTWLRDGAPIAGATRPRYTYAPDDVGHHVRVRVVATKPGYTIARTTSPLAGVVRNRVDVRRTVTYSVATKGHVTANLQEFRRLAQQTYDDPRGWLAKGVRFRPVRSGGSFTLWLAEAATVPSFSSGCSATYSCRVGRNVIINQTRWLHASPAWHQNHGSLRDYRNLVVNHETGHWLGYHHSGCPGPGQLAPVMMQQSKGLDGCRINPWPTVAELNR